MHNLPIEKIRTCDFTGTKTLTLHKDEYQALNIQALNLLHDMTDDVRKIGLGSKTYILISLYKD
jgi:hypothetical protein